MARGQSLVAQLRAVVLPALVDDERAGVVAQMFQSVLDCSAKAMAALKLCQIENQARADADGVLMADDKKRSVKKVVVVSDDGDNAKPHRQRKRRRLADECVTLETPVPHYDGHQWRKYGQKVINNAKHPRSYYRCTYGQEQGCKATKTVQQKDDNGAGAVYEDDQVMFAVVYYGQHTCKPPSSSDTDGTVVDSDSRCSSNISVTCTSVAVIDHHRQSSLESSLLDMAEEDLATEEYDQLFDVAAYEPLDSDPAWEMDDAHGHGHGILKFGHW